MTAVEPDILSSMDDSERLVCSNISLECMPLAGKALKVTVVAMTSVPHLYLENGSFLSFTCIMNE